MSLLKVNEVQNYNGRSLTLTASTVSTSAQLNTGGNVSVTGSINVSDDSTTRSNLGLGSIATQDSSNVTITGGNISNATLASSVTFSSFVGLILPFAYDTSGSPPSGFLECDGSPVSRTTYSDLFSAIGTTWGAGDGSTTFNLPDLQGAFLRGTGSHGSSTMANGSAFAGPNVGSFENDSFQGHRHTIKNYAWFSTTNSNEIVGPTGQPPLTADGASGSGVFDPKTDGTNGTPRTDDETRPFNAGVMYCIKF